VINNRSLAFYPEKLTENGADATPERIKARAAVTLEAKDLGFPNEPTPVHLADFYDCVKTRKTRHCPLEIGDLAAVPGHLATKSLKERRPVRRMWRPGDRCANPRKGLQQSEIRLGEEGNDARNPNAGGYQRPGADQDNVVRRHAQQGRSAQPLSGMGMHDARRRVEANYP
jgi:hypothetical protein